MLDWEKELKKYLVKKFKESMNIDLELDDITTIKTNYEGDLNKLNVNDLTYFYAFSIMKEDFEQCSEIMNELIARGCDVDLSISESDKTANLRIIDKDKPSDVNIVYFIMHEDGMIIDFEKSEIM